MYPACQGEGQAIPPLEVRFYFIHQRSKISRRKGGVRVDLYSEVFEACGGDTKEYFCLRDPFSTSVDRIKFTCIVIQLISRKTTKVLKYGEYVGVTATGLDK